jgi:hypothetical protein
MSINNILAVYFQASKIDQVEGENWYDNAHQIAIRIADEFGLPLNTVVGVISAISPNNKWASNVIDAENLIKAYSFEIRYPKVSTFHGNKFKAITILERKLSSDNDILQVLRGDKVTAFYQNIATNSYTDVVTVDGHAYNIWNGSAVALDNVPSIGKKLYRAISESYREAAKIINQVQGVNYSPSQVQAITWVAWRRMIKD